MDSNRMLDRYFESARNTGPSLISSEEAADLLATAPVETEEPVAYSGVGTGLKVGVGMLLAASIAGLFFVMSPEQTTEGPVVAEHQESPAPPTESPTESPALQSPDLATLPVPSQRTASPRVIAQPTRSAQSVRSDLDLLEVVNDPDEIFESELETNRSPRNASSDDLIDESIELAPLPSPFLSSRVDRFATITPELEGTQMRVRQISELNTIISHEYNPLASPDGRSFYFASNAVNGLGGHDIWLTTLEDGPDRTFSPPVNIGSRINSSNDEGGLTLSLDGMTMIYTSCGRRNGLGDCDLYEARYTEDGWEEVRNLTELNTRNWDSNPTLSSDGTTLYFVSDRPGTIGGNGDRDIFVATRREDGTWSLPKNLGSTINTRKKEDSPFLPPGGDRLYFSSEGHQGEGGYDFFVAMATEDGEWGTPSNLGREVNTPQNERFLSVSAGEDRIYFARDDKDEKHFDLWMVEREAQSRAAVLNGRVRDTKRNHYIRADLIFVDHATGEILGQGSTAGADGRYNVVLGAEELARGGEIDVYGIADSLGDFHTRINLPERSSYATYEVDLAVDQGTTDALDLSRQTEGLSVEVEGSRLILQGHSAGVATIIDGRGVVRGSRSVKEMSNRRDGVIDLQVGLPDGLYLVRLEGKTGLFRIR